MHDFDEEMNGIVTTVTHHANRAKRNKEAAAASPAAPSSTELSVRPSSPSGPSGPSSPSGPSGSGPKPEASAPEPAHWCLTALATVRKGLRYLNVCRVENPHHIDNYSRVTFPLSFVIVNLLYWTYYLYF